MNSLQTALKKKVHPIIPEKFLEGKTFIFDFTRKNRLLSMIDLHDTKTSSEYINNALRKSGLRLGIGKYAEDRMVYKSSIYKTNGEARTVHLGVDLFVPSGTPVFAPIDGTIHSFQDNNHFLDYGPTVILEHKLEGTKFYTLYGHLSRTSLNKIAVKQKVRAGQRIAIVGKPYENGSWPSHLHFQIITDLLGKRGDFPGVARPSEREYYLQLCPDPNLLLKSSPLKKMGLQNKVSWYYGKKKK